MRLQIRIGRSCAARQFGEHTLLDVRDALKLRNLDRLHPHEVIDPGIDRFGEFQMEYEQAGRLQLYVYLDNGSKCIQVPLKTFAAEKPVGGERLNLGSVTGRKKKPGSGAD